jgi:hypothetical protein
VANVAVLGSTIGSVRDKLLVIKAAFPSRTSDGPELVVGILLGEAVPFV